MLTTAPLPTLTSSSSYISPKQINIPCHANPPTPFKTPTVLKSIIHYEPIESPPMMDPHEEPPGLPRTPSPSSSPSLGHYNQAHAATSYPNIHQQTHVPMRYQRFEPDHHFKKKFFHHHREQQWTSTNSDVPTRTSNYWVGGSGGTAQVNDNYNMAAAAAMHHKQGKFRPKGKDWDWSTSSGNSQQQSHNVMGMDQAGNMGDMQWQQTTESRYAWDQRDH